MSPPAQALDGEAEGEGGPRPGRGFARAVEGRPSPSAWEATPQECMSVRHQPTRHKRERLHMSRPRGPSLDYPVAVTRGGLRLGESRVPGAGGAGSARRLWVLEVEG